MGGTRFVGKYLVSKLMNAGYELTLFTRGNQPFPSSIEHVKGDRSKQECLELLDGRSFDIIIDTSGRKLEDTKRLIEVTGPPKYKLIYISSAGVYASSSLLPIDENSEIDPLSRHIGKVKTENWLINECIPFTSFRPTYIYGPGNYNPIEKWFFDRIVNNQPIPIPSDGNIVTQLGHVSDLTEAIFKSIEADISINRIYNCSGKQAITFKGLASQAAIACGLKLDDIKIKYFDYSTLDPKARKAFPLRISHFFTDISRIESDLNWTPTISLNDGLKDSYDNDYLYNKDSKPDFSMDDLLA